jgi:predicted transcriptional regulator
MSRFRTIIEAVEFLKLFNFSEHSIIEVCRQYYFTRRERKVFDHYSLYLQGRTQAKIGYLMNMAQPAVSYMMKRCRTKIKIIEKLMKQAPDHLDIVKKECTSKAYEVLIEALIGVKFIEISRKRKCTVFNISLICNGALKKLKKTYPDTFNWVFSLLRLIGTVRSNLPSQG